MLQFPPSLPCSTNTIQCIFSTFQQPTFKPKAQGKTKLNKTQTGEDQQTPRTSGFSTSITLEPQAKVPIRLALFPPGPVQTRFIFEKCQMFDQVNQHVMFNISNTANCIQVIFLAYISIVKCCVCGY